MKILVVDDDPAILNLCATALRAQGHEVQTCSAGNQALAAALMHVFDLALCDLNLPDVHGLEIVRAIKMQAPDLPVIVISALDPREWRLKSVEAGADHFIQKPLRLDVLRHEVKMAGLGKARLSVALYDPDDADRTRLEHALRHAGCEVRVAADLDDVLLGKPDLTIVAAEPGVESVVFQAGAERVHCFVLVPRGTALDDRLLRMGASLMVEKPVDPEALLVQARFLATRG